MARKKSKVGLVIKEVCTEKGITQIELAQRMGSDLSQIRRIVCCARRLTPVLALKLELVLGVPAMRLMSLQAAQDLEEAKQRDACSGQSISA